MNVHNLTTFQFSEFKQCRKGVLSQSIAINWSVSVRTEPFLKQITTWFSMS